MQPIPARVSLPATEEPRPTTRRMTFDRVYRTPRHTLSALVAAAITLFCIGASVASAVHFAQLADIRPFVDTNLLAQNERRGLVKWLVASGGGACLISALWLIRRPNARGVRDIATFADVISPLLLTFALPLFLRYEVFVDKELLCVSFATIFGLLLERSFRRSYRAIAELKLFGLTAIPSRVYRLATNSAVGILVAFFCIYFSYYTVQHHYQLETRSFDLAIFDNIMWNLLRGKWFKASPVLGRVGSHIRSHATFDAYLFAPFYALRQKADTLLVLQATLAGLAIIPLYLTAKRKLASAAGAVILAYAYVIHPPLHGPIFYDFHFVTTATFFVSWVLYCFETNRKWWLVTAWLVAVLLREELSATFAMVCLFYLLAGRRPRVALIGGMVSTAVFILIKFVIMPLHSPGGAQSFTYVYAELIPPGESGFGPVISSLLSNPLFTLSKVLTPEKFAYLMKIMTPVLFLPFRHARAWILLFVPAMFTLLSSYAPVIQTYFQYTSIWTAYLFFATAVTLASWRGKPEANVRIWAALSAIAVTASLLSYNFGAIFQHRNFRGGFTQVSFTWSEEHKRQLADLYDLIAMMPSDASVAATETEAPHVSNRENCFTMRNIVEDPDYLLVKLSEVIGEEESRKNMISLIKTGSYAFIDKRGPFALWGKGASHTRDGYGKTLVNFPETP